MSEDGGNEAERITGALIRRLTRQRDGYRKALIAARDRAHAAERRAWGYGRAYTELLEKYERNTIGGRGIAELTDQLAAACAERDAANAAFDELSHHVRLETRINPERPPKLATYIRERYARERDQWKANHDQRKAERDAARAELLVLRMEVAALEERIRRDKAARDAP